MFVAHGFKGFKDWGWFPWLAEQLAAEGLEAVRFDFSHNGVEARDFDRLDLFARDNARRHQADLVALLAARPGPVGLLGHSRGGGDVLVCASRHPRVRCVATLASVAQGARLTPESEAELCTRGFVSIPNMRTKQQMPLGREAFDLGDVPSPVDAARALRCPTLLVHGEADTSVAPTALDALATAIPHAETWLVPDTDHVFGTGHPWGGPSGKIEAVASRLRAFFAEHLLGRGASA